jgi:hypothetical protein
VAQIEKIRWWGSTGAMRPRGPAGDQPRLVVHEVLERPLDDVEDARRALHDLVGEEAAFAGDSRAMSSLRSDIGHDLVHRVRRRVEVAQGASQVSSARR